MSALRQYRFRALVMLDRAARAEAARCGPGGTRACCLVEPSGYSYFPAVISTEMELPVRTAAYALVTIALHASEARTLFTRGQRFAIWADAVVGHTVQAAGLLGYGVICASPRAPRASRGTAAGTAANAAPRQLPDGSLLAR